MCHPLFDGELRQSEDGIVNGNVVTYGDVVPVLEMRYGLNLSTADRAYIERLESELVKAICECCIVPIKLVDREYFSTKTALLRGLDEQLLVLDDLYFGHLMEDAKLLSSTRYFNSVPPSDMAIGHRKEGHQNSNWLRDIATNVSSAFILDDGVFSGSTLKQLVTELASIGVSIPHAFVVIARADSIEALRQLWGSKRNIHVLGFRFTGGWDHSRDLLGLHGLRVGKTGYIPYWNVPHWVSLQGANQPALLSVCRSSFRVLEEFLGDTFSLKFKRDGLSLHPQINGRNLLP